MSTLNTTNVYRARHQALALTWNASLAAASAIYAQKLASTGCTLKHSVSRDYGENLFMMQRFPKPDTTCTVAARSFYGEVQFYKFNTAQPYTDNFVKSPHVVGHFTQLVWRGSRQLGCGVGYSDLTMPVFGVPKPGGCKVVVCRYRPPGNWATDWDFLVNVFPNTTAADVF